MLSKRQFFLIACLFFGTVIGAVALLMDRLQRQAYEAEARNPAEWGSSVGDTAGALIISVPTKDLRAQDASVRYAILCVFGVLTASLVGISCFLFSRVHQRTCQLIASEKKLRKREARWRMVLNSAQDPMITTDRQGIVQTASDSTDAVLGWKPHELVGENISVLMPEPYRSEHDEYLARYQRAGVSHLLGQPRELPVLRRDGTVIPCLLTLWQVDVPDGSDRFSQGSSATSPSRNGPRRPRRSKCSCCR